MAWVLAALNRWPQARNYAVRATRYETQDPELQYHAAVVAAHTGHRAEARYRLRAILSNGDVFHPFYATDARRMLAALGG